MSKRATDTKSEKEVSLFCHNNIYPYLHTILNVDADNVYIERVTDKERQYKGVDTIYKCHGRYTIIIDEKAATGTKYQELNVFSVDDWLKSKLSLETFVQEVFGNTNKAPEEIGWLYKAGMRTTHLSYIWLTVKEKKEPVTQDNIIGVTYILVEKAKLHRMFDSKGIDKENAYNFGRQLLILYKEKKQYSKWFNSFCFNVSGASEHPVNIIVKRMDLYDISYIALYATINGIEQYYIRN